VIPKFDGNKTQQNWFSWELLSINHNSLISEAKVPITWTNFFYGEPFQFSVNSEASIQKNLYFFAKKNQIEMIMVGLVGGQFYLQDFFWWNKVIIIIKK